jgi:putative DNA primase/helicase
MNRSTSDPHVEQVASLRAKLWDAGFRPVPVYNPGTAGPSPGKRPWGEGWQISARLDPPTAAVETPRPEALNTGILCDGLRAIDLDIDDPTLAHRCRSIAIEMLGDAPVRTRRNSSRCLIVYRAAEGMPRKTSVTGTSGKIEVLGQGQQFVAFGRHQEGTDLEWFPNAPGQELAEALPAITGVGITLYLAACAPIIGAASPPPVDGPDHMPGEAQADPLRIAAALAGIPNGGPADWDAWNRIGMAVWGATGGGDAGWEVFNAWSARSPAYNATTTRERWDGYAVSPPTEIGAGSVFNEARKYGKGQPPSSQSPRTSGFSDDALALGFSERHDGEILFVPTWGHWLRWDGCRWIRDDRLCIFDLSRTLCRDFAAVAAADADRQVRALASRLTNARTVAAVETLARSDQRSARSADAFDNDPWILNTPGGIVDLRTGMMREHQRSELVTKVTSCTPGGPCRRWMRFLIQVTQGDRQLIRYLQRLIGYSLTGVTREHSFVFIWGPGGNGKSVLLNAIAAVLGDYCTTAMADVFSVGRNEQHPTHLATLRGARMVIVTEVEEGAQWAESRLKSLTAGDRIAARFMRGDPFEFTPTFKLWIAGNHRPVLRNPDVAMRRRLNLIPMTFVPNRPDAGLADVLRTEQAGILAWAIRGCLKWQRDGLHPPAAVKEASTAYFTEQDSLAAWVDERCQRETLATTPSRALFSNWKRWMDDRGEDPGTEKRFSESLERLAAKKRTSKCVVFLGLKLRPPEAGVW